jgi:hypothetical protein
MQRTSGMLLVCLSAPGYAQAPAESQASFEVASIKLIFYTMSAEAVHFQ